MSLVVCLCFQNVKVYLIICPRKQLYMYVFLLPLNLYVLYFSDYKMHSPQEIWEENGDESYSPNVAYLAHLPGEGGAAVERVLFSYFPPLKPRCVLWTGASYSPKKIWYVNLLP